tara:strand:+ start:1331 stop:1651 length:321 start_codon:yes stop_codon:yes gene_type:complete
MNIEQITENLSFDFGEGLSRSTDPEPSHEAGAVIVKTGTASQHRNQILAVMSNKPRTNAQNAILAGLSQYQTTRRMTELERLGRVERGPIIRCPVLGRKAGTWKLI